MNHQIWEELYLLAATEVDGQKIPDRVAAAREGIRGRLLDLEQSSDHHVEREQMKISLENLNALETSAAQW